MIIDLTNQMRFGAGFPMMPVRVLTATAAPFDIVGVPPCTGGRSVDGVRIVVTNADGAEMSVECRRVANHWAATFAATCFGSYGEVERGFRVVLVTDAANGAEAQVVAGMAHLSVVASSANAKAGDPNAAYQAKGGDVFVKANIVEGVQHYKLQTIAYDADMEAWGAEWSGDYILVDGEFVSVEAEEGTESGTEEEEEGGAE